MSAEELQSLKAEIATTENTIRNLRHHADQLVTEASELEKILDSLKARWPQEKTAN